MSGLADPELDPGVAGSGRPDAATLVAVAAGGALGGLTRFALAEAAPAGSGLPWATLGVNVAGSAAVGVLVTLLAAGRLDPRVRPFAVTGVCGGLTTFSTVMTEVNLLARDGRAALAGGYLVLTLGLGLVAAWAGTGLGSRAVRRAAGGAAEG